MGAAHSQHGPRVGRLQAQNFGAVGRVDEHILIAQLDEAVRQRFDLQRLGDAGGGRPTAVGAVQVERRAVHGITQQRQRGRQCAGHNGERQRQHNDNDDQDGEPPLLALLVERRQGFEPRGALRGRLLGRPGRRAVIAPRCGSGARRAGAVCVAGGGVQGPPLLTRQPLQQCLPISS